MPNELYWDHTPAGFVSLYYQKGELLVFFEGNTIEKEQLYFGNFVLKQTLEMQTVTGKIEYKTANNEIERFNYRLVGAFEDESWEIFQGTWYENEEVCAFNAIFEPLSCLETRQKEIRTQWDYPVQFQSNAYNNLTNARQKRVSNCLADAALSIHSIQRSIELSYGLPHGSVQLINPDHSVTRAKTAVGSLRRRWILGEQSEEI